MHCTEMVAVVSIFAAIADALDPKFIVLVDTLHLLSTVAEKLDVPASAEPPFVGQLLAPDAALYCTVGVLPDQE